MLFPICFFRHFIIPISVDYQYVTNNQQDFKKKITHKGNEKAYVLTDCFVSDKGCYIDLKTLS